MQKLLAILVLVVSLFSTSPALAAVGYLGPAGTFTEEVAQKYFSNPEEKFVIYKTVAESLQALKSEQIAFAVVPVENTLGGPVYKYLDDVLTSGDYQIVAELNLPIRQQLFTLPNTALTDIKTVYSHPQGLAQSRTWLNKNLPHAKLIETSSTAEAVRLVAESNDLSLAGIAGPQAGKVYPVKTLAEDLQITRKNVTRFWVVKLVDPEAKPVKAGPKSTIYFKASANDVAVALQNLLKAGYTLDTIHDQPAKTVLGEYNFLLELNNKNAKKSLKDALKGLNNNVVYYIMGEYPVFNY